MSLISHYVICDDDRCYKEPVFYDDSLQWYVVFDDASPPELVVRLDNDQRPEDIDTDELLEEIGLSARVTSEGVKMIRFFPPEFDLSEMIPSVAFDLRITKAPPADLVGSSNPSYDNAAAIPGEYVLYRF